MIDGEDVKEHEKDLIKATKNGWPGLLSFLARYIWGQKKAAEEDRELEQTKSCPKCNRLLGASSRICPSCGIRL